MGRPSGNYALRTVFWGKKKNCPPLKCRGRAATSTILPYTVEFSDIEEERKTRPYVYFTGFGGAYSHAGFKIKLNRKPTPYILNYYLPSALFVMVSWTSFVIPADAIPGRVALLVTTFLSLANIINSAFAISPINQGINQMQVEVKSLDNPLCLKNSFFAT